MLGYQRGRFNLDVFDSDLDTLVDVICTALIVDAQLQNVAILDRIRARLLIRGGQADMVQEGPRRALGVLDPEFGCLVAPDLGMSSTDYLAFESEFVGVLSVESGDT